MLLAPIAITVLLSVAAVPLSAQHSGCTDPQALNYDPAAEINDGSCDYPVTIYVSILSANLPTTVRETSGLAFAGGMLWTHNDSGHPPQLFVIDTLDGSVLRQVTLINASNEDWEDLAQSDTHLFIGDFGNNNGNRTNLRIYRVGLDSLLDGMSNTVWADTIAFSYPDQMDFSTKPNNNEYDCEAFFFRDDTLHLFTKNWVSLTTRYYTLPATPGNYVAELRDSFNVDGLITGASHNPEGDEIVLCGYKPVGFGLYTCFAWLLWDYPPHRPFEGNKRRIELGTPLQMAQLEAVWLNPDLKGWMTGESISAGPLNIPARLHQFDFSTYFGGNTTPASTPTKEIILWTAYPNPTSGSLYISVSEALIGRSWMLLSPTGTTASSDTLRMSVSEIDISHLPAGVYYLHVDDQQASPIKILVK